MTRPTPKIGRPKIDEFLASLDFRISDADKTTPPESKERLRAMRPLAIHVCVTQPDMAEKFISKWVETYFAKRQ